MAQTAQSRPRRTSLSARISDARPVIDGYILTVETVSDALGSSAFEVKVPGATLASSAEGARALLAGYAAELLHALGDPGALK